MSIGSVEVDQRIQAVAGRVLQPELVADARCERFVGARRARQRVERRGRARVRARGMRRGSPHRACRAPCRRPARRAARPACGSCSAPFRSTCRSRCWRRCRRSSRRRSTPDRGRSCGRSGASRRLAAAPITPGCSVMVSPPAPISQPRQLSPSITSTESLIACPERLVPAARNVTGVAEARAAREQAHDARPRSRRRRRSWAPADRSSRRCPRSAAAADR